MQTKRVLSSLSDLFNLIYGGLAAIDKGEISLAYIQSKQQL